MVWVPFERYFHTFSKSIRFIPFKVEWLGGVIALNLGSGITLTHPGRISKEKIKEIHGKFLGGFAVEP